MVKEGNQYLCLVMIIRKKYDIEYLFQNSSTPGRFLSFDRQKKKQIKNILLATKKQPHTAMKTQQWIYLIDNVHFKTLVNLCEFQTPRRAGNIINFLCTLSVFKLD